MPNLKVEKDAFHQLMGKEYKFEELEDLGFEFGIEVEEDKELIQENITKHYYKFDCMNNRPDLLSEITLTRTLRIYLEQIETPRMTLSKPTTKIVVDPSVIAKIFRSSKSGRTWSPPS